MERAFLLHEIMKYSEKLRNPKWQKKRLEILKRDNFECVHCQDTETELHIHHLKYTGEPWEAPNGDLETVCKHCHTLISRFEEGARMCSSISSKMSVINTNHLALGHIRTAFFSYKSDDLPYYYIEMAIVDNSGTARLLSYFDGVDVSIIKDAPNHE